MANSSKISKNLFTRQDALMMLLYSDHYSCGESSSSDDSENYNEISQNSSIDSQTDTEEQNIVPKRVKLAKRKSVRPKMIHVEDAYPHDKSTVQSTQPPQPR